MRLFFIFWSSDKVEYPDCKIFYLYMSFRILNFRSLKPKMRVIFHEILINFFSLVLQGYLQEIYQSLSTFILPNKKTSFIFIFILFFLIPSSSLQFQFTGKIMFFFDLQLSLALFTSFSLFYYYPKYNLKIHVISILYHIF